MRYMLLIYTNEHTSLTPETVRQIVTGHRAAMEEATKRGFLRGAEPLFPTSTATTVRIRDGKAVLTDGPFAETKEHLAGYYILECDNLDDALEIATKIPTAYSEGGGCVEVRPIRPMAATIEEAVAMYVTRA